MNKTCKKNKAINRALFQIEIKEKLDKHSIKAARPAPWKTLLEDKVPPKVYVGLESAFYKAFSLVFHKGKGLIEKGCRTEQRRADFAAYDSAVHNLGGSKELRQLRKSARKGELANISVTTLEGLGLGAMGIGLPDIVLFLGNLLKGMYELALGYGYGYESPGEQLIILKTMETALSRGDDYIKNDAELEQLLALDSLAVSDDELERQLKATSAAFAMDMLLLKFIQGIPVIGIIGGAANPLYYRKIMSYAERKYRKAYLKKAVRAAHMQERRQNELNKNHSKAQI